MTAFGGGADADRILLASLMHTPVWVLPILRALIRVSINIIDINPNSIRIPDESGSGTSMWFIDFGETKFA